LLTFVEFLMTLVAHFSVSFFFLQCDINWKVRRLMKTWIFLTTLTNILHSFLHEIKTPGFMHMLMVEWKIVNSFSLLYANNLEYFLHPHGINGRGYTRECNKNCRHIFLKGCEAQWVI
jgi:hypothetical protein